MVTSGYCKGPWCSCPSGDFITTGGPLNHLECVKCSHKFMEHSSFNTTEAFQSQTDPAIPDGESLLLLTLCMLFLQLTLLY